MCARSNAAKAADSSCVGGRGGEGGVGAGLVALTAASFCVVLTRGLTLEIATFLAAALRATGFGLAVLAFALGLALAAAVFFAARSGRAGAFAALARFAFGLVEDFALTARFAEGFALERDVERLNPFVRLLLMGGISKGCSPCSEQPSESAGAYHSRPSKSTSTKYLRVL